MSIDGIRTTLVSSAFAATPRPTFLDDRPGTVPRTADAPADRLDRRYAFSSDNVAAQQAGLSSEEPALDVND